MTSAGVRYVSAEASLFHYEQSGVFLHHFPAAVSLPGEHLSSPCTVCHWTDEIFSSCAYVEVCKCGC